MIAGVETGQERESRARRLFNHFMMFIQSLLATLLVSAATVKGEFKPAINNTLEKGVQTECKTCPFSLCTNKAFYSYSTAVTLACWTSGDSIGNDT